MTDAEIAADGDAGGAGPQPSRRPRLFGFLIKRVPGDVTAPTAEETEVDQPIPSSAGASLGTEKPAARRRGLFGRRAPDPVPEAGTPADAGTASAPVDDLPFGRIVRVCGVAARRLGTEVARSEGAGSYRLYDSDPASTALRAQFLTGFDDGCARQFTAALALFGTSAVHEATRYNPLNTNPYSATDEAYELAKSRLCRVRRGQPCPEGRSRKLARESAFVSVYRGFGHSGDWMEIFLHDGEVAASAARAN